MPRKSAAALATITPIVDARPAPPDDLTEAQAAEWEAIVKRMPHDWFTAEVRPLLSALCRHIVLARDIAKMIDDFDRSWVADMGGLERLDQLAKMQDREHRAMCTIATKLRITLQSRVSGEKAATLAKQRPETKPWSYVA